LHNPVGINGSQLCWGRIKSDVEFRMDILGVVGAILLTVGIILAVRHMPTRFFLDMKTPQGIFILSGFTLVMGAAIVKVGYLCRKIRSLQGVVVPGDAPPI
jgi:hypothetical protein